MTGTLIDVVILTWNDGDLLRVCVDSVLESRDVEVAVVVVDNGSDPPAVVPDDPRVQLVRNDTNRGVAPARNQGVRLGHAPLVCLLDSDASVMPDAFAAMVAALDAEPGAALAGPVFVGQEPGASAGGAPTFMRKLLRLVNVRDTYASTARDAPWWDVDFTIGACQLFRRAAFDAVDGLDETYFYGPEDVDFCLRLRKEGWRVLQVRGAAVHHPPRRRFRGLLSKRGLQHARAVLRHLWRHRGFQRRVPT